MELMQGDIAGAPSGGFANLPTAIATTEAMQPMKAEDTAFHGEDMDDRTALGLVLTDVAEGLTYIQTKALMPTGVDNADDLIRAFAKPRLWADGKPRANLPMFTVLEAIEKLMPVFYMALFGTGKKQPFSVTPVGKTTPVQARALGHVLNWAIKQADLKEEMRLTLKTCLSYGFCVGWWGWNSKPIRERTYEKGQDNIVTGKWEEFDLNIPSYENSDLKNIVFDPNCKRQDVQKGARWIAKQVMITANDLDDMRHDKKHFKDIPTNAELRVILSNREEPTEDTMTTQKRAVWREFQAKLDSEGSSSDPLMRPLEYIEYWTNDRVIGVLQRKIVIRNHKNEWSELPGVSCAFVDVLGSAWGFGAARLLAGEQRFQAGVANNWIDSLALILNPVYQALKGVGPGTQNIAISPGKVITETSELKALVTPDVSNAATGALENSEARAAKRVGAEGGSNLIPQALRTGGGVQAVTQDVVQKLQYFLEIFISRIYLPVLEKVLFLCKEHLQPADINRILTEEEGKAWEGDIMDLYKAKVNVDVIAGADLLAKTASAQLTQTILQLLTAAPVQQALQIQGVKFDFDAYIKDTLDIQGIDEAHYFLPMTDADLQRAREMNQALVKGQQDQALEAQKQANALDAINEKGTVQAGVALIKRAGEAHMDEALDTLKQLNQGQQPQG